MKLSNLKPVLSVILAFALLLAVSACGNRNIPAPSVSPGASAPAPVDQTGFSLSLWMTAVPLQA